ncbi:hypothetical protein [Entomomonas asaccharolytica]|uniref:DUF4124 domain-containing protein n=1 Tax=Entomomonas asaccharolytica TaxID=2785331 RepID=A0A974RX65_9GAMM|nr:hypothetical protein [Entomomonas asaccharolytica]QQP85880.1 hypothetical protein JHT90_01055 [Entomomonas asaccharolytica]
MKNITQIIVTLSLGFILSIPTVVFAQQKDNNKILYKWQDTSGKWHYSKIPPSQTSNETPSKIEVAKDSRTLIFAEKKEEATAEQRQETIAEAKLRQQRISCQTTQTSMMSTALYLHRIADKNYQEKNITLEEYNQEKLSITQLEEMGSDPNFYDYCMDDFSRNPHFKGISDCITKEDAMQKRVSCLQELPPM